LALAASSHANSSEDRLTELYALALEEHEGFASRVFALADLPPAVKYEAYTQEILVDGSGRLDLRVRGLVLDGEPVSLLYAEHKQPGAGFQKEQPEKYLPSLRQEARSSRATPRFMVVVGSGDDTDRHVPTRTRPRTRRRVARADKEAVRVDERRGSLVIGRTWQQIANCAELAGREADAGEDKLDWRERAEGPGASASQRVLRELLWYFEEEGYAVTNGLTAGQLSIAVQAVELEDTLRDLFDATTPLILKARFGKHRLETVRGGGKTVRGVDFKPPVGSWVANWRGGIWFGYVAEEKSRSSTPRQLQFQVGVWLPRKEARVLDGKATFKDQLKPLKHDLDDGGWIWSQAPAVKFVSDDPDELLDSQATALGAWAVSQLQKILSLRAGRPPTTAR